MTKEPEFGWKSSVNLEVVPSGGKWIVLEKTHCYDKDRNYQHSDERKVFNYDDINECEAAVMKWLLDNDSVLAFEGDRDQAHLRAKMKAEAIIDDGWLMVAAHHRRKMDSNSEPRTWWESK